MGVLDRFSAIRAAGQAASRSVGVSTGALGRFSAIRDESNRSRRRQPPTTEELKAKAQELELINREYGAREIEQDKPGAFAKIVDILSRPNYAIAGLADELLQGKSVSSAAARAMREFFSGIPGLEGDKEAWGQVLEQAGVPTKTLSEVFPMLEDTWVGNFGSRGAAGLALDILTDPLTYITGGSKVGFQIFAGKAGTRWLSKAGRAEIDDIVKKLGPQTDEVLERAGEIFGKTHIDEVTGKARAGSEELFQKGGARFMGAQIPGTDKIAPWMSKSVYNAVRRVPGGEHAIEGAKQFADATKQVFSAFEKLVPLGKGMRSVGERLHRNASNASMAHRGRLFGQWEEINTSYKRLLKSDKDIGRKFYELREGTATHSLTVEQQAVYDQIGEMYDGMFKTGNAAGILDDEQFVKGYFAHSYENADEFNEIWAAYKGDLPHGAAPRFTKERQFLTYEDAVDVSKRLNGISKALQERGIVSRIYPELTPDYNVMDGMRRYIQNHADLLARKAWTEDAVAKFGKEIADDFDISVLYDLEKPLADISKINIPSTLDGIRKALPRLSPAERQEVFRRMLKETKTEQQLATLQRTFADHWEEFPNYRPVRDGDFEPVLREHYGEKAKYVTRVGGFWGEKAILIPKAIADDIEKVNTKIIRTGDHKGLRKMLNGYDRANNLFKLGVYTLWPASAIRDAYSNIALSMLDIGFGAINPKSHLDTVAIMAGREGGELVTKTGVRYGWKGLRQMAKDMGVWVPGEVFIEATGGGIGLGKTLKKAARARGAIENEARMQLWLTHISRGLDPRTAAGRVSEFLFNYGEVSQVERELLRRLIPFYTFTRKNIELQWKMLRKNPGMQINQVKPFRQRNDESESMVKYEAEGLAIRLDRDGKTVHMLTGIDLPLRNIDTIWKGGFQSTGRTLMGMVTPLIKTIPEILLDKDFFTNRLNERATSPAVGKLIERIGPKPVKDWLGYAKEYDEAGRPKYTFDGQRFTLLFRSWALSRLVSTSDRQFREYLGNDDWGSMLLDVATGIRNKEINLDEQGRRKLQIRIRQLEEMRRRRGLARGFTRTFTPKQEVNLR